MIPGIPVKSAQQKSPSTLRTSEKIASGSVLLAGTGVPVVLDATGWVATGDVAAGGGAAVPPIVTPGTVESAIQPEAPSYQARSDGLNVPAASWRFISSNEKGPNAWPFRVIWTCIS